MIERKVVESDSLIGVDLKFIEEFLNFLNKSNAVARSKVDPMEFIPEKWRLFTWYNPESNEFLFDFGTVNKARKDLELLNRVRDGGIPELINYYKNSDEFEDVSECEVISTSDPNWLDKL